jgi:hypothetical protein
MTHSATSRNILAGIFSLAAVLTWVLAGLPSAAWANHDSHGGHGSGPRCPIKVTGAVFTSYEFGSVVNGNLYGSPQEVYLRVGKFGGYGKATSADRHDASKNSRGKGHDRKTPASSKWGDARDCDKSKNKGNTCDDRPGQKKDGKKSASSQKFKGKDKDEDCDRHGGKSGKCDDGEDENDGGQHGRPSSLPDGLYYFQVTDPSGQTLLSLDDIQSRQFEVVDGYIQDVPGSHNYNVLDAPYPPNYTVVQLTPFRPTPNTGGAYKVWVTPVATYQAGQGYHGFLPNCSKTDNFKVRSNASTLTAYITGMVFGDTNLNGQFDTDEPFAPNVKIVVYPQGSTVPLDDFVVTGTTGQWSFQLTPPSLPYTYRVEPVLETSGVRLAPTLPPAYEVTIGTAGEMVGNLLFGVVEIGTPAIPLGDTGYVSGGNIEFYPGYWSDSTNDEAPSSEGETILQTYFDDYVDPEYPPAFLSAPILQQACAAPGPLGSAWDVKTFLLLNAADTAPLHCRIAALWLSLTLAIETNGTPADTALLPAGEVISIVGSEVIYYGLHPVTGQPLYGTVGEFLDFLAGNFGTLSAEEAAFFASALEQATQKRSFVREFSGPSEEF